jgi:hypothetical protein
MNISVDLDSFQKTIDEDTGSILFYKKDFKGFPDEVINGDGWTVEIKDKSIVMIDIYKPKILIEQIINSFKDTSAIN